MLHKPTLLARLLCIVVVWGLLDLYLLPLPRCLLIPLSALMTTLILWMPSSMGKGTTTGYEMHKVIQENYELSQTILRLTEEHQLLCEIRHSVTAVRKNSNESLYLLRQVQRDAKKRVLNTKQESTSPPETTPFVVPTLKVNPHTNKTQEEPKETFNKERARQALASASITEKGLSNSKTHSFHSLPLLPTFGI